MQVQVNKGEIENLYNQMTTNQNDLTSEIKNYLSDVDKLKQAYQSAESASVLETFTLYLEKLKTIPYTYEELNKVIKKAGNIYVETDSAFKLELEKENSEDEKYYG